MSDQDRDSKTEAATPQRIIKAMEDGQLGISSELTSALILVIGVIYFWLVGGWLFRAMADSIRDRVTFFDSMIEDPSMIFVAMFNDLARVGFAMLALLLPLAGIATIVGALQSQFNVSMKPLELKLDKMSIKKGIGKIFSSASLVRTGLSITKATVIVLISYLIAHNQFDEIQMAGMFSIQHYLFLMCQIMMSVALATAAVMALLGIVDLAYQKWKHLQDLKMSVQDIRDEHKDSEGDPMLRARMKKVAQELSNKRTLQEVPNANVIITNPTHFAVAVQYDRSKMIAPTVLAKGGDHLAKKIIEIAKENGVPVVERKPVARFLYFNVDVGREIPADLYQAVAEVLNYVNQLKNAG